MRNDDAFFLPVGKTLIALFVVVCISVLFLVYFGNWAVVCDEEDEVILSGVLMGFQKDKGYWNVKVSNVTYLFDVFDSNYMQSLIGFDITINTCWRCDSTFTVQHYDMISAWISEVE